MFMRAMRNARRACGLSSTGARRKGGIRVDLSDLALVHELAGPPGVQQRRGAGAGVTTVDDFVAAAHALPHIHLLKVEA